MTSSDSFNVAKEFNIINVDNLIFDDNFVSISDDDDVSNISIKHFSIYKKKIN